MSTATPKLNGLTNFNLSRLSQSYLQDRINTKGLTKASIQSIKYHFKVLLNSCPDRFPSSDDMIRFLGTKTPGRRRRMFETYRAFAKWMKKRGILMVEPWSDLEVPRVPIPLLKAPSPDNVRQLFTYIDAHSLPELAVRDKAIIATLVESGLRLFELAAIKPEDIDWQEHTIRVWGKGCREGKAPFGQTSETLLKQWLVIYKPTSNIWSINGAGIQVMLKRLHEATGITCNPHSFRRAFASILLKSGIDSLDIKRLGRWQSLAMIDRYTRSVQFDDSLKHYKAPLS
jgi:site-specific recombinase XerD